MIIEDGMTVGEAPRHSSDGMIDEEVYFQSDAGMIDAEVRHLLEPEVNMIADQEAQ